MLKIFTTEKELAYAVFKIMQEQLENEKKPVFSLAAGSTPKKIYNIFSSEYANDKSLSSLKIVSLDEWVNVAKTTKGSCYQMLNEDLFKNIILKKENIIFFETVNKNLKEECKRIDDFITKNPITFSLMGVGINGHIGLNEPMDTIKNFSSIVELSDKTKETATKYFKEKINITHGITLGLGQIIKAKKTIVVITGIHKKEIVKEIFEGEKNTLPAQALLDYQHIDFFIDETAGSLLTITKEVL
ncbi:MAG: 6-phosphogluconolactonase [Lachnospirales bacterium]